MISEKIIVKNASGLHARPAAIFAKEAGKCASDIVMIHRGKTIQPKSILSIMAAAIKCGDEIELQCSGDDEEQDLRTLLDVIESGLGE